MDITIFKELTTEEQLVELQLEADKYTGLYVDMSNAPERKYVKETCIFCNGLPSCFVLQQVNFEEN